MKSGRFLELEGLRGFAALMVVAFHYSVTFYPTTYYGVGAGVLQHNRFEDNVYENLFSGMFNGIFWVAVFFIISGFVLSIGFFSSGQGKSIVFNTRQATKRYARLMVPAATSVFIAYLILQFGLNYNLELYLHTSSRRLFELWNFTPDLISASTDSLWGVFFGQYRYNPVLWTMQWELLGSFLIFSFLALFGRLKGRNLLYVVLIAVLWKSYLAGFIVGVFMADLYAQKITLKLNNLVAVALFFIGVLFAGYPKGELAPWKYIEWLGLSNFQVYTIGSVMIMCAVLYSDIFKRLFSMRVFQVLGRYSFSLYLLHDLILLSLGSYIFLLANRTYGYDTSVVMAVGASLALLIPASRIFYLYVDSAATGRAMRVISEVLNSGIGKSKKKF